MSRPRSMSASSGGRRPSRVDELLNAIDQALANVRASKGLRAHYPRAYADLERNHEAARRVVLAVTYEATVRVPARNGLGTVPVTTRRPLWDDDVATNALEAIGEAYGIPQ